MKKNNKDNKRKKDLIIEIILIIVIIILLIHNCSLAKYQNNDKPQSPNGNIDIIDINCDNRKCDSTPNPMVIQSISFTEKTVSIKKGDSLKLIVEIKPTELSNSKLTWKSSNTNIVTVDSNGIIKAKNVGEVTITVTTSNGKTATCKVKVTKEKVEVDKIKLSFTDKTIKVGATTQLIATIKPENATNRELVWSSSDESIATVDSNGVIKGISSGTVTITVKTKDGQVIATSTITVETASTTIQSINFPNKTVSVKKGDNLKLIVEIKPTELSSAKLTWKSSNDSIVTVDTDGVIKGINEGEVTITVTTSNGKTATCKVKVVKEEVEIDTIKLSFDAKTLKIGATTQLIANIEPENATNRELVWSSSDESIATIDSNGIIKAKKAGRVTITVKTKDGKVVASSTITVEPTPTPTPLSIQSISFPNKTVSIKEGDNITLIVEIKPTELSSSKLTWKSSNTSVVTVDNNGVIKGISEGEATITVTTTNGKTATCKVMVTKNVVEVEELLLNFYEKTISTGTTTQLIATIRPENATNRELVWSSSDESVATVDNQGVITGISAGTVTITVKTKDGNISATSTIIVMVHDDGEVEVYDDDHTPVSWNGSDDLKIFTRSMYNDEIIAPESSNTYEFVVRNSTKYDIKYSIDFVETNNYHINMKYKLKKNDTYIIDHYVSYNELNLENQVLGMDGKDTYYLEWKWVSSNNDTNIGQNPEAKYGLQIEVKAESING